MILIRFGRDYKVITTRVVQPSTIKYDLEKPDKASISFEFFDLMPGWQFNGIMIEDKIYDVSSVDSDDNNITKVEATHLMDNFRDIDPNDFNDLSNSSNNFQTQHGFFSGVDLSPVLMRKTHEGKIGENYYKNYWVHGYYNFTTGKIKVADDIYIASENLRSTYINNLAVVANTNIERRSGFSGFVNIKIVTDFSNASISDVATWASANGMSYDQVRNDKIGLSLFYNKNNYRKIVNQEFAQNPNNKTVVFSHSGSPQEANKKLAEFIDDYLNHYRITTLPTLFAPRNNMVNPQSTTVADVKKFSRDYEKVVDEYES